MIKSENKFYNAIVVLNLILMIPGAIGNVVVLFASNLNVYHKLAAFCSVAALLVAFFYLVAGYSKQQAPAYRAFCGAYTAAALFGLLGIDSSKAFFAAQLIAALIFGLVIAISLSKNYGKTVSTSLCILVVVLSLLQLLGVVLWYKATGLDFLFLLIFEITQLLLSIVLSLTTFAKYVDKTARGTN